MSIVIPLKYLVDVLGHLVRVPFPIDFFHAHVTEKKDIGRITITGRNPSTGCRPVCRSPLANKHGPSARRKQHTA